MRLNYLDKVQILLEDTFPKIVFNKITFNDFSSVLHNPFLVNYLAAMSKKEATSR